MSICAAIRSAYAKLGDLVGVIGFLQDLIKFIDDRFNDQDDVNLDIDQRLCALEKQAGLTIDADPDDEIPF